MRRSFHPRVVAGALGPWLLCAILNAQTTLPRITTSSLPSVTVGSPYSGLIAVTDGTPPYSNFAIVGGALPPGVTLNSATGAITGTPTVAGSYNFWVSVTDSAGNLSMPQNYPVIIAAAPAITAVTLANAPLNTAYTYAFAVSGGTPPFSNWTVIGGSLPPNFVLDRAAGVLNGFPTSSGFFSFQVTVQDSFGIVSQPVWFSLATGLSIFNQTLPNWTVGTAYSVQLNGVGGTPPYGGWTVASGVLPPGLTLNTGTGLLSGTPTATGSYSFGLDVTDSVQTASVPQNYTIAINPVPVVTSAILPPGTVSTPYSAALTASGGTQPISWTIISGALPAGLTLYSSPGLISGKPQAATSTPAAITFQAMDAAGVTATASLTLAVNQATLLVSSSSLTFNLRTDDPGPLASQSVSVFSNKGPVTFTETHATTSGGGWMTVSGGGGITPGNLLVSVSTAGLTPNTTYTGHITVAGQTIPNTTTIPVTVNLVSPGPAQLSVAPSSISLNATQSSSALQRVLVVRNSGTGTLSFSASVKTDNCGSWLYLLNNSGSTTYRSPGELAFLAVPQGLGGQTCTGQIAVAAGSPVQTQSIPVSMTVSSSAQSMQLTQTGLSFQAAIGGPAPPAQSIGVWNAGSGAMNWTVTPQTLAGGNWLSATPGTATSVAGVTPPTTQISVDPTGLGPGQYYGSVQVTSADAGNSPQSVTVALNVSGQTAPLVSPAGVILAVPSGSTLSEIETVSLTNPQNSDTAFVSTVLTDNHQNWLTVSPMSGTLTAGASLQLKVQANAAGIAPGVQHGVLRMAFTDGTIHDVEVYLIVPAASGATPGCLGNTGYVAVFESPEQGFHMTAQNPITLQVLAKDCNTGKVIRQSGGAVAEVLIGPDNTIAVSLADDGTGVWRGTWTPSLPSATQSLTARLDSFSSSTGLFTGGQATIQGVIAPALAGSAGTITGVSGDTSGSSTTTFGLVKPGSTVLVSGVALGDDNQTPDASASGPNTTGGTQVLLQGLPLQLIRVNSHQVSAVVPKDVRSSETQQMLVVRDGTQSTPVNIQVASVSQ